ncbi:2313_t:CDS:2, partial [Racocetra persica]
MKLARVFAFLILIVQLTLITPSWALEKRVWPRRPINEVRKR